LDERIERKKSGGHYSERKLLTKTKFSKAAFTERTLSRRVPDPALAKNGRDRGKRGGPHGLEGLKESKTAKGEKRPHSKRGQKITEEARIGAGKNPAKKRKERKLLVDYRRPTERERGMVFSTDQKEPAIKVYGGRGEAVLVPPIRRTPLSIRRNLTTRCSKRVSRIRDVRGGT